MIRDKYASVLEGRSFVRNDLRSFGLFFVREEARTFDSNSTYDTKPPPPQEGGDFTANCVSPIRMLRMETDILKILKSCES